MKKLLVSGAIGGVIGCIIAAAIFVAVYSNLTHNGKIAWVQERTFSATVATGRDTDLAFDCGAKVFANKKERFAVVSGVSRAGYTHVGGFVAMELYGKYGTYSNAQGPWGRVVSPPNASVADHESLAARACSDAAARLGIVPVKFF